MKYEKPDLEELDLVLEGSYLLAGTGSHEDQEGFDKDKDDYNGDDWD